jgi:predicted nucleotidyltransferase
MSRAKSQKEEHKSVIYSEKQWDLLKNKRNRAIELLSIFSGEIFTPYVYGSLARGDIDINSDIDIVFLQQIPLYKVEFLLHKNGYMKLFREIIMATPKDSIKLYIYLNELETITIPLTKLDKNSIEFYDFGGKVNFKQLQNDTRVPGINKSLLLIKPNLKGHIEYSIIGREHLAAKEVEISLKTINERKKVLLKREKVGRTGVFLKKTIGINQSTEEVLKSLANTNSIVRKKLFKK